MDDTIPDAYATHTVNILRVAAGHRQAALAALQDLEGHIVGKISTASTINKQARLEALLTQTRGSITETYDAIAQHHGKDLRALAGMEAGQTAKVLGAGIGADVFSVAVSAKQLEKIADGKTIFGASAAEWWKGQDQALQNSFQRNMQQGLLLGETNDQLIQRVRGTKANAYNDGIMAVRRRDAATLVRTSAISTANSARLATLESMQDVVKGIQWVSTLDGRTTPICKAISGKEWRLPDYEPVGHDKAFPGPVAHMNCRSTQVPVLRSWDDLAGKKLPSVDDDELEAAVKKKLAAGGMNERQVEAATVRTRASMDGQVPDSLTMDKWLETKDDTFINDTLGPGRAKLWDRGKGEVSLSDMTDQSNRPLTIAQLKDLVDNGTPVPETLGVDYFAMNPDGGYVTSVATEILDTTSAAALQGIAHTLAAGDDLTPEQQQVMDGLSPAERRRVKAMARDGK